MAEEAEVKNTNKLVAIIAGVVLAVVAAVVTIVIINNNKGEVLNDDFFKTTNDKIVISNSGDNSSDPTVAKKVHQVYFVNGDKITGLKVYSEFESEQAAKDADAKPEVAEAMKSGMYKDHKVQGKYIIVTMNDSMYQETTVEQLRTTAELLEKMIQNGVEEQQQTQTETENQTTTQSTDDTSTTTIIEDSEEE